MTRLLTLAALGLAIAFAPTPSKAQTRVPNYFHLLDQDQPPEDGSLTRRDFEDDQDRRQYTQNCINRIRSSSNYDYLPSEDKTRLRRLYNIAGGGRGRVISGADRVRDEFTREHPDLELEPDGC